MNRWQDCITHADSETLKFIDEYFSAENKEVLIIAGAGFDPRSTVITEAIAAVATNVNGIYIREERPNPATELLASADANVTRLHQLLPQCTVLRIDIFDPEDGAVVGAKRLMRQLTKEMQGHGTVTDIVLDLSALSIGISFPLVRYIFESYDQQGGPNIHLFAAEDTALDAAATPEHTDQPMYIPGFSGDAALDDRAQAVRLWIPQLVKGRQEALRRIYDFVGAKEACPILPFPSRNLRRSDELLEQFVTEVSDTWEVDSRNYIYSAEREPLDLYRTLLRLDDARKRVYEKHGGSLLVLSPIGSKVIALGALLAALERNFPVAYLESISYSFHGPDLVGPRPQWPIIHIWLCGDPYTQASAS